MYSDTICRKHREVEAGRTMVELKDIGPEEIAELVARGYEQKFQRPVSMVSIGINSTATVTHFNGSIGEPERGPRDTCNMKPMKPIDQ